MKQIAIFTAMLMMVISCGSGTGDAEEKKVSNDLEIYKKSHNEARPMVEFYFTITESLVAGDIDLANDASTELLALMKREEFAEYKEIKAVVSKFREARSIEDKRLVYVSYTNEIYQLLKNGNLPKGELFLMHCPMAFENKGANWISYRKEVLNPYFGEKMLNCGAITEEL